MTAVAIISAIYGCYDALKPACEQDTGTEWILVTGDPGYGPAADGWRVIYDPQLGVRPCRAAKRPKFTPWEYTTAEASIWIDASIQVESPSFASAVLAAAAPVAQFPHPHRDCIYAEAAHSVPLPKYAGEPLTAQAARYRQAGHPEHWGLWCGGVIGRHHTPEVIEMGKAWQAEVDAWSFQDQVSEPFVLRRAGLRPAGLPGDPFANPWTTWAGGGNH